MSSWIDLAKPEIEIHTEYRDGEFYVTDKFFPGVDGLPYGFKGCLVVLASAGIDSAYASWMAMERGVIIIPAFIDLGSYWSNEAEKLSGNILKYYIMNGYQGIRSNHILSMALSRSY